MITGSAAKPAVVTGEAAELVILVGVVASYAVPDDETGNLVGTVAPCGPAARSRR